MVGVASSVWWLCVGGTWVVVRFGFLCCDSRGNQESAIDKLQSIRYFLKLCETLSFKGTAEFFGVPSSTVSRALKALEAELGVALVERTTRRVRLTEAGRWYRGEVVGPLRALAMADELVDVQAREPSGRVRITAMQGYGELRLFKVIEKLGRVHPLIVCDLDLTNRFVDLSSGNIDIAIRATAAPPEDLVARRLHDHRFVLVASPSYLEERGAPSTLDDLRRHEVIAYRGPAGIKPWHASGPAGDAVYTPEGLSLVSSSGLLMLRAVAAGQGLTLVPRWSVRASLADGSLREVLLDGLRLSLMPGPVASMYLLYDAKKKRLGRVRATVDFFTAELSKP